MTNLEAKQEAIKKAYGEYFIHADINGWIKFGMYCPSDLGIEDYDEIVDTIGIWRCKSLQGIENNNGWIRIESEEDLPKEEIDLHFIFEKNNGRFQTFGVWDNKIKSFYSGALKISNVTHYQPIEKPKPPIF